MNKEENIILTSLYKDCMLIRFSGSRIVIERCPDQALGRPCVIRVSDSSGSVVLENKGVLSLPFSFYLPYASDGLYTLTVSYLPHDKQSYCHTVNSFNGFPFQIINGESIRCIPDTLQENRRIYEGLSESFFKKHRSSLVPYTAFIPEPVIQCAHHIVKRAYSNYDKILAVHDWVADNIHYDYDSLHDRSFQSAPIDAMSILKKRRTVCCGYSALAVSLLRAVGVMAINMDCFALSSSTHGGWRNSRNMSEPANHVVTFAYADDRWVMMDTTWDSNKEYRNGKFLTKPHPLSHMYFDSTLAFFSFTHRFIL